MNAFRKLSVGLLIFSLAPVAHAWGRRGHSIVCQTSAAVLSGNGTDAAFLKKHSVDLGYYCNVPDLIWKKPATYADEAPQHFMDLEIYDRAFKAQPPKSDPFQMSRLDFEAAYPTILANAGRAYWRVTELMQLLDDTAKELRVAGADSQDKATFQSRQEKWLVTAGAIGHYVGDLSQPLHVTENYDGAMSGQNGIHSFFEDTLVDELSSGNHPAKLESDIGREALNGWAAYHKASAGLTNLQVIEALAKASNDTIPRLLRLDKEIGRKDVKRAARMFEPMIRARLVAGALALAELWSRELAWPYDGEKFYEFTGAPDYIAPPKAHAPASVKKN